MVEILVHKFVESDFPKSGKCKIAWVAEAPGVDECLHKPEPKPLVGASGQVFNKLLRRAGAEREDFYVGNVFRRRPPENNVKFFFMNRTEAKKSGWDKECPYPINGTLGYVRPEWVGEVDRLRDELKSCTPTIVVGMGATSLWALTGRDKIGAYRGVVQPSTLIDAKTICTYHPAAVLRMWHLLPTVYLDFKKALRESKFPEIRRKNRQIWINPTLDDIAEFYHYHIKPLKGGSKPLAYDIETIGSEMITCVGFAPTDDIALVIPFMDKTKDNWCYWPNLDHENSAWSSVKMILEDPSIPKVAQNGLYDIQWLLELYGIKVHGTAHDTMLMHHALEPELPKSLGFLASLYLNEPAWKTMVNFKDKAKEGA